MPYGTLPRTALLPIISDVQTFHSFIVPKSICMWNSKIVLQFYFLFSSGKALAGYHEPLITLCCCPIRTILCWLWTWTPAFLICCSNGFPYRLNKLVSRAAVTTSGVYIITSLVRQACYYARAPLPFENKWGLMCVVQKLIIDLLFAPWCHCSEGYSGLRIVSFVLVCLLTPRFFFIS